MNRYLLISTIILLFSCAKKEGNIVLEGQKNQNPFNLISCDTLSFTARTVDEDSLPGNGLRYALLGNINDEILGKSTASLYANISLIEPNTNFPNTETADSAVLFIPSVDGLNFYGNLTTPQTLIVDKLNDTIVSSSTYYQTDKFTIDKNYTTSYSGKLINYYTDSMKYRKNKLAPYNGLRIKLSKQMADHLMSLPKEAYQTNLLLSKHFKGIAITPEDKNFAPGDGGFAVYDINNIISLSYRAKILLYYQDTNTFTFGFSGSSSSVTNGKTGPYNQNISDQISKKANNYQYTYCQALSGVKTKIEIPNLLNLIKNGNVAVNYAEIELFITDYSEEFFAPPRMNLFQPSNANSIRNYFIQDALSTASYGGVYDPIRKSYKFIMSRYIQNIFNKKHFDNINISNGLYLAIPSDQPVIGARCVIDHSKTKIKILYTKPN